MKKYLIACIRKVPMSMVQNFGSAGMVNMIVFYSHQACIQVELPMLIALSSLECLVQIFYIYS